MRLIFLLPVAALMLLGTSGFSFGQDDQGADTPDASASQLDMNALETVNGNAGTMLENTNKRIEQMQEYLQQKGELQDYRSSGHGDTNNDGKVDRSDLSWNLSFDQAVSMAKQHDAAIASGQSRETPDQRRTEAYRKLVKSTWDDLHNKMAEVHAMSEYLSEKGQFNDYQAWARQRNSEANQAMIDDRAEKSKAAIAKQAEEYSTAEAALEARKEEAKKQHDKFMKNAWQQYKFNQEESTKRYKYNQKYAHGYWNSYNDGYGDLYGGGW